MPDSPTHDADVVVVGAGLAGLYMDGAVRSGEATAAEVLELIV